MNSGFRGPRLRVGLERGWCGGGVGKWILEEGLFYWPLWVSVRCCDGGRAGGRGRDRESWRTGRTGRSPPCRERGLRNGRKDGKKGTGGIPCHDNKTCAAVAL